MHANLPSWKYINLLIIFSGLLVSGLFGILANSNAADTATVTATVMAQNISVAVNDSSITYGAVPLSGSEDTTSGGINDTQTATNDGNITEDLNIRGTDSAAWTLAGSIGANQYVHSYCTSNCDTTPTWTPLTLLNQTLASGVLVLGTQDFDLKLDTPSSTSSYLQQSVDVTVQAVAP